MGVSTSSIPLVGRRACRAAAVGALCLAALCIASLTPAHAGADGAPDRQQVFAGDTRRIVASMSASELIRFLSARGLDARRAGRSETSEYVDVEVPEGGVFSIALRVCDNGAERRCKMAQPYANFSGAGVTLGLINQLLIDKFVVGYGILNDPSSTTIASKIIFAGGVTEQNLVEELALYLYDLESFAAAVEPGALTQVDFKSAQASPFGGLETSGGEDFPAGRRRNDVGANAPKFLVGEWAEIADMLTK